jgi:hypothetical protein
LIGVPDLVMKNGMRFGTCLWHIATAFRGKTKIEIIEGEAREECCSDVWARFGHG